MCKITSNILKTYKLYTRYVAIKYILEQYNTVCIFIQKENRDQKQISTHLKGTPSGPRITPSWACSWNHMQ
ncbi:hypothetical protein HanPSC8_Chr11g0462221 [Helianthus annuus]|nr:hypothetical protein HanPSC8_Chr11g0462221 [Helianthus annuus]